MSTIRPQYPQMPAPQTQGQRLSGQSAIFALARGKPAETPADAPASPVPATVNRTPEAAAEPPQRLPRPGSLLDIRI